MRGSEVHLTPKEFDLLTYFLKHPGKVLTHRTLLAELWGGNYVEQNEYLRVFVGNLRKKIETDGASPRYILTEPWIGYRFNPSEWVDPTFEDVLVAQTSVCVGRLQRSQTEVCAT